MLYRIINDKQINNGEIYAFHTTIASTRELGEPGETNTHLEDLCGRSFCVQCDARLDFGFWSVNHATLLNVPHRHTHTRSRNWLYK